MYDKRDNLNLETIKFPRLCSNLSISSALDIQESKAATQTL